MYLSCLLIDATTAPGRRWLASPYHIHQRLLLAFPEGDPGGRLLFRIEDGADPPRIIVQAPTPADWVRGFHDTRVLAATPRQKAVSLPLHAGQRLRFLLRANPTLRRLRSAEPGGDGHRGDGDRLGLLRESDQRAWLERKGEAGGFRPLAYEARSNGLVVVRRGADEQARQTHVSVDFEGHLEVVDPAAFLTTVDRGLGAGKAFGFGLLSVAPQGEGGSGQ